MLNRPSNSIFFILVFVVLLSITKNCLASNRSGFVEYTNSINTTTFKAIKTIGIYSRGRISRGEIVYGGLKFSHFDQKNASGSSGLYQLALGVTTSGPYAPFVEIGTDFLSLFSSRESSDCGNDKECRINAFIKAGIRFRFQHRFTLGIFHESMSFDDTNTILKGSHNYTGLTFGYDF